MAVATAGGNYRGHRNRLMGQKRCASVHGEEPWRRKHSAVSAAREAQPMK